MACTVIIGVENNRVTSFVELPTEQDCREWISANEAGFIYNGSYDPFLYVAPDNTVSVQYDEQLAISIASDIASIFEKLVSSWGDDITPERQSFIDNLRSVASQAGYPRNIVWPQVPTGG